MASLIAVALLSACSHQKAQEARTAAGEPLIGFRSSAPRRYTLPVELALGTGRPQDTATFGEWVHAAYRVLCPDLSAADLTFEVRDGLFKRSEVSVTFKPGTRVQPQDSCRPTPPPKWIASVRFSDLAVTAPDRDRSVYPAAPWLNAFRRGDPLPTSLADLDH